VVEAFQLEEPRRISVGNVKQLVCKDVDWKHLTQDRKRVLVNSDSEPYLYVMNSRKCILEDMNEKGYSRRPCSDKFLRSLTSPAFHDNHSLLEILLS
jgi:hypothetical protein